MDSVFDRVIKLALRTGDKVIVVDPSQSKPYVMMDFDDYERLISRSGRRSGNLADNIVESELQKEQMRAASSGVVEKPVSRSSEPRVASALAGSDPLEPDRAAPRYSYQNSFVPENESNNFETEEQFFLEPLE